MNLVIQVEFPDTVPDMLHQSKEQFEKEAKMAMAVKLFEMKKISSGMAANITGMERVEFLMELHKYGVAMIDISTDELQQDIINA